jgi:hypothetical protein
MTIVGSGNISGFHYSNKNCEEIIRDFFEKEGFKIDEYNIPFTLARNIAVEIRAEKWYREYFDKSITITNTDVTTLVKNGFITLVEEK